MCGLLHLVQRGGASAGCGPAQYPLTVPNVSAHPSTACVPTSNHSTWQLHLHSKGLRHAYRRTDAVSVRNERTFRTKDVRRYQSATQYDILYTEPTHAVVPEALRLLRYHTSTLAILINVEHTDPVIEQSVQAHDVRSRTSHPVRDGCISRRLRPHLLHHLPLYSRLLQLYQIIRLTRSKQPNNTRKTVCRELRPLRIVSNGGFRDLPCRAQTTRDEMCSNV